MEQQKITKPVRYAAASGEEFVVMPARDYTVLTGIDADMLPTLEVFDTVVNKAEQGNFDTKGNKATEMNEHREAEGVSALAHLTLEEEIGVENLPL